jgi:hypothetical protein
MWAVDANGVSRLGKSALVRPKSATTVLDVDRHRGNIR